MIIEDLIRMGKPLLAALESGPDVTDLLDDPMVLEWLADAANPRAKGFFHRVFVVEIGTRTGSDRVEAVAHPYQDWTGDKGAPDLARAVSAPFVLPVGGNPLNPQGRYPAPVYLCYDPHLRAFAESPDAVLKFLAARLERTLAPPLNPASHQEHTPQTAGADAASPSDRELLAAIAEQVHRQVRSAVGEETGKVLGLLILARCVGPGAAYRYVESSGGRGRTDIAVSALRPTCRIELREGVAARLLEARVEEARDPKLKMGKRAGNCTFCGARDSQLLPPYCKAWPWFSAAWSCPMPAGGTKKMLIEGPALCPECYRALVLGASVVSDGEQTLLGALTSALFSPVTDRTARERNRRPLSQLPQIHGLLFLTPLLNRNQLMDEIEEFVESLVLWSRANAGRARIGGRLQQQVMRQIRNVVGFENALPESVLESDAFRISLLYYSGDRSRGDVHVRCLVQDVLPSTVRILSGLSEDIRARSAELTRALGLKPGGEGDSPAVIPVLLARAYGPAAAWPVFQAVLHRNPISMRPVIRAAAHRFRSLTHSLGNPLAWYHLRDEVRFLFTMDAFVRAWNRELNQQEDAAMMKPWTELYAMLERDPAGADSLASLAPADLGFLAGACVARFSAMYYKAMEKKDFLVHRVMTFGSSLGWREIRSRALAQMLELEHKLQRGGQQRIHMPPSLRAWTGALIAEITRREDEIARASEDFTCGFWAGYALGRHGRRDSQSEAGESIEEE